MNTTQIKDGLILIVIAAAAIGGVMLARKVIGGVGSVGQGISEAIDAVTAPVKEAIAAVSTATTTTLENHGTVAPPSAAYTPRYKEENDLDYQYRQEWIRMLAAGGMGA